MDTEITATDFLVECSNPEIFDNTIQQVGRACLLNYGRGRYVKHDDHYIMRVFGDAEYVKYAIDNQGYGKIIKELPQLS